MPREWDAADYDRLGSPMTRWGETVVSWLQLDGDERVLDAGCGTGRVTERLLERLPHGHVIALDGSKAMVERAQTRLEPYADQVECIVADLTHALPMCEPVDAILSTATFHWILDHDTLFANLAAVLRPGGQLAAQCGGAGNTESILAALRELGEDFEGRKHFATPEDTRTRLERAGFTEIETWLQRADRPRAGGPGAVPRHDLPRRPCGVDVGRRAGAVRSTGGRSDARTTDRLRATEHPGASPDG